MKLINEDNDGNVSGVILSIRSGTSYDNLFSKVEQKSKNDTVVLVYSATSDILANITRAL